MNLTKEQEKDLILLLSGYETCNLVLPFCGSVKYPKFINNFLGHIAATRVIRKYKKFKRYLEITNLDFKLPLK